jgi:uncharacterized membrane protein YphA (DoxX/SURF4 family)
LFSWNTAQGSCCIFPRRRRARDGKPRLMFTGLLETLGGCLIAFGMFTRLAALLLSGERAVGS